MTGFPTHPRPDCGPECFGCKCQSIHFDPYAMPNRLEYHFKHEPRRPVPSWERGIPTDSRGMPFLRKDGTPMGQKEYSENRSKIDEHKRRLHNSTEPVLPAGHAQGRNS